MLRGGGSGPPPQHVVPNLGGSDPPAQHVVPNLGGVRPPRPAVLVVLDWRPPLEASCGSPSGIGHDDAVIEFNEYILHIISSLQVPNDLPIAIKLCRKARGQVVIILTATLTEGLVGSYEGYKGSGLAV